MKRFLATALLATTLSAAANDIPDFATAAAEQAVSRYDAAQVELLAELVRFRTVHEPGTANADHPEFHAFADHLEKSAHALGLDFTDLGAVLVIGLGAGEDRLGVVTHGDVQPADASKWQNSPFELDMESEPGRLIARGAEDNKAPIATALYAMKTLKDMQLPLIKRIELIVALTEESDWAPLEDVLARWQPPRVNVAIDSSYPVVVAEKGWGRLDVRFDRFAPATAGDEPVLVSFEGGAFISQVPENARFVIGNVDDRWLADYRQRLGARADGMTYAVRREGANLIVEATGKAAHSSAPENGLNAITHLAATLEGVALADTPAARAVHFVNALLGTGLYGERFGNAAYSHDFMGPLTMNLSLVEQNDDGIALGINLRAPAGKTPAQLESELRAAIAQWSAQKKLPAPEVAASLSEAYYPARAPQVDTLLAVYRHYTGDEDAQPVSIGGGTNARLLPNGVNFGPSMPGVPYTGHSEHEFITREQMTLNLKMYTAMLATLAGRTAD